MTTSVLFVHAGGSHPVKIIKQTKLAEGGWKDGDTRTLYAGGQNYTDYVYEGQRYIVEEVKEDK